MGEALTVNNVLKTLEAPSNGIDAEGAKAIAEGLFGNASLTECNLRGNDLGDEGWKIIFNALRDSPTSRITTWDLSYERLGPEIAKPLAEYISVTTSMTRLDARGNQLGEEGNAALRKAIEGRSGLELLLQDDDEEESS